MSQRTKVDLSGRYRAKGAQQVTLQEYRARQEKAEKSKIKIPSAVKFILATPFLIVFSFGLFFIPFLIFQAVTASH